MFHSDNLCIILLCLLSDKYAMQEGLVNHMYLSLVVNTALTIGYSCNYTSDLIKDHHRLIYEILAMSFFSIALSENLNEMFDCVLN